MAVKNLQSVVQCVANTCGVVVTGMRKDSMRAAGSFQSPFLSLPRLALAEPFPYRTGPDNGSILRAGRSARQSGVVPGTKTALSTAMHRKPSAMSAAATRMWQPAFSVLG